MKATFKNCYGLEDFTLEEIKFDAQNSKAIIYAPNGVMKSSFSKVLDDISRKKKTVDRIFTERNGIDIMCANSQTREWANRANACRLSDKDKAVISEVLLITPESIHVNAFMYEPLIDIPNYQLTDLYQSCKGLGML